MRTVEQILDTCTNRGPCREQLQMGLEGRGSANCPNGSLSRLAGSANRFHIWPFAVSRCIAPSVSRCWSALAVYFSASLIVSQPKTAMNWCAVALLFATGFAPALRKSGPAGRTNIRQFRENSQDYNESRFAEFVVMPFVVTVDDHCEIS